MILFVEITHIIGTNVLVMPKRTDSHYPGTLKQEENEVNQTFQEYLENENLSSNTISSYQWTVAYFEQHYDCLSTENLLAYKGYLMEYYKPKTVNLRIQAMNKYFVYLGRTDLHLNNVKLQQKNYLENVISNADYLYLKKKLKNEKNRTWYFVVWYLAATGARISELTSIKAEHVILGHLDIYGKGGKNRRLYIPQKLRKETLKWLEKEGRTSGYLFLNRKKERISVRGISQQLKRLADRYQLDKNVIYPHSFRHLYAKNFLEKYNDLSLLADLMGHESIETTRVYLRKTALEQQRLIDTIVTW